MAHFLKHVFYFLLGGFGCAIVLVSISYLVFTFAYRNQVYPGVISQTITVDPTTKFNFVSSQASFSATAAQIELVPDNKLMGERALSVGRQSKNPYYNFLQIIAAWQGQIILPPEVSLNRPALEQLLDTVAPKIEKPAVDAVFTFNQNTGPDLKGRVVAFRPSENGLILDREKIYQELILNVKNSRSSSIPLYSRVTLPTIETSTADHMGIKNFLGRGESYFYDSIPGRVYNIKLGTEKITGSLVAPDETFSFATSIGTVSAVFGFQKAYAIIKGKTVLDDGGGVCQVSTTLYRAVLNAGLPVIARTAHAYRVGFYEQGGFKPGLDATVYPPSPDFKFKNDTGHWLLIQATFDPAKAKLIFDIFGTSDGRQTAITGPFILSTSPPPEPIYEDDPNLPAGQVKQVDTAHFGANVYFERKVIRGDQLLISEIVRSNYIPWPARFLRGTKS